MIVGVVRNAEAIVGYATQGSWTQFWTQPKNNALQLFDFIGKFETRIGIGVGLAAFNTAPRRRPDQGRAFTGSARHRLANGRPMAELLSPTRKDISATYEAEFRTMTLEPVPLQVLLEARERLIAALHAMMTDDDRAFLLSIKGKTPDWSLLGLEGVGELPAVKWKLQNLARMSADKHEAALARLGEVLHKER